MANGILLIECADQQGIVSSVTEFIYTNKGNIIELDQYLDHENNHFFMRIEWSLDDFTIEKSKIGEYFHTLLAKRFNIRFNLYFNDEKPKMALFVTKLSHCLIDLLGRWYNGTLQVEIPVVVSNHEYLRDVVEKFGLRFHHIPITKDNKVEQEQKHLEILKENNIDFVVLARYMQIIGEGLIKTYGSRIINIHHSFLPAFVGAKPYHAAYARGVKIIGATAHYVTEELDAGPIIEQEVSRVSHHNTINDLVQMGQDVEKITLAKAVKKHVSRKTLVVGNKTIIFN
jgi:formyltetrahydrofolate deformylase